MRSDQPPADSTRFFARLVSGAIECPKCGSVAQFGPGRPKAGWNPQTSRFTCPACRLVVTLGIIAWPAKGGPGAGATLPTDHVPNERQLSQLRAAGDGHWMRTTKPRRRAEDTNLTARCTCPSAGEVNARCVFHGYLAKQIPDE